MEFVQISKDLEMHSQNQLQFLDLQFDFKQMFIGFISSSIGFNMISISTDLNWILFLFQLILDVIMFRFQLMKWISIRFSLIGVEKGFLRQHYLMLSIYIPLISTNFLGPGLFKATLGRMSFNSVEAIGYGPQVTTRNHHWPWA